MREAKRWRWVGALCAPWLLAGGLGCGERSGEAPRVPTEEPTAASPEAAGQEDVRPSGLRITHVVVGDGESPTAASTVRVHYHGTFEDGSVFDSSVERGQPASFPLARVIPCWTEGVSLMKVGGKASLVCPPAIAYGPQGAPPRIPPNATLAFDVELLEIVR